ncbi:TonB-dependent receptor [Pseudoxanthomonas sp. 10H]|uniref:TonB-dependent receptor n=1 Tax=Pseudoxanthomonas sp. 10H TaxID=3242729 RepID=UPI003555F553
MPIALRVAPRASCPLLALSAALYSTILVSSAARAAEVVDDGPVPTTLDAIEVKARQTPLDASAGSTSHLALDVGDLPASVTVIDRQAMDVRGVRTTQDALAGIPGVTVAAPPGNGNAVTWRGFSGSQVSQLFNGIDVQYATIAARPVDAWQYTRVEAIGGPSSFLYGAGAVGGAINYVTRLADLQGDTSRGQVSIGSHDDYTVAFGGNLRLGTRRVPQALALDASWRDAGSWIDRQQREALAIAGSWRVEVAPGLQHTLALEYQDEDNHRPYWGTPARQRAGGRLSVPEPAVGRNYNVGDGYYGQDVRWARSLLEWAPGEGETLRNTAYHYDALRDYRNVESYRLTPGNDAVVRSGALLQRHDQQVWGDRVDWTRTATLAGLPTQWAIGADASYNRQTRFPLSLPGTVDTVPLDAVAPGRFLDVPGMSLTYAADRTNRVHTLAAYVENLTSLTPSLSLLTGLRHDRIDLDVTNHRTATPANPSRFARRYRPTSGRVAFDWALSGQQRVYAQYSTAADPPAGVLSTASLATVRDFDLSTGRQVEVGARFQSRDGRAYGTVAGYRIVRRNLATSDPANPGQTLPVGQQSSRGVEVAFGWKPGDALSIDGNLAWVDARLDAFTETVGGVAVSRAGNTPANTPARVGTLWADYAFDDHWSAGVDLRAVSSRYVDAANTLSTAGYATWGAHVRWKAGPKGELVLRGRNLGDRTWVAYALNANMVYLGDPRSWELLLRRSF